MAAGVPVDDGAWVATHRLTVRWAGRPDTVVLVYLEPGHRGSPYGYAYTAAEWARDDEASWEHRPEGWLLDGVSVLDRTDDRPAATSIQVERIRQGPAR